VLLIGDSISAGYAEPVRQLLQGRFDVRRIPENGATTVNGLNRIDSWLGDTKWDVIHFNFGLHDLKIMEDGRRQVDLAAYEANLGRLAARLKATGARLIWASTTPVPDTKVSPPRRSSDVPLFNTAARRVMEANRIEINDLYSFALPQLERIQTPANVHFSREGSAELARQVAAAIGKR
jgi:acyl-CoA thioesterase-1